MEDPLAQFCKWSKWMIKRDNYEQKIIEQTHILAVIIEYTSI